MRCVCLPDIFMVAHAPPQRLFSMGSAAETLEDLCGRSLNAHPSALAANHLVNMANALEYLHVQQGDGLTNLTCLFTS